MKKTVNLCDMCYEDGEEVIAVASYIGDDEEVFYTCKKHLENVKEAKLPFNTL